MVQVEEPSDSGPNRQGVGVGERSPLRPYASRPQRPIGPFRSGPEGDGRIRQDSFLRVKLASSAAHRYPPQGRLPVRVTASEPCP